MLGIPKVFRQKAGLQAGDNIVVTIEKDTEERKVDVPSDLAQALRKDLTLNEVWKKLSYTIRKEQARGLEEAKKPETRARRLEKTLEMLRSKVK